MSQRENPSETAEPVLSEPDRICRSAPDRRRALIEASDALAGTPGASEKAQSLACLAFYVDELEERVWSQDPSEPSQAEIDEEAQTAAETDQDFLHGAEPEQQSMAERVGEFLGMFAHVAPHVEPQMKALREACGLRSFRDEAAIALLASAIRACQLPCLNDVHELLIAESILFAEQLDIKLHGANGGQS